MRKAILTMLEALIMIIVFASIAFAGTWKKDATGWWYDNGNGTNPKNCWQWIDNKCYYFDTNGYCLQNTTTPDGCQVNGDGAWIVNGVVQTGTGFNELDQLADSLKTFEQVEQYWQTSGFGLTEPGYDHHFHYNGLDWSVNKHASAVFKDNTGNCGGTANLLIYLLKGDYSDMGYILREDGNGGHVVTYFRDNAGIYHIMDQTAIVNDRKFGNHVTGATLQEAGMKYVNRVQSGWDYMGENLYIRSLYAVHCTDGSAHPPVGADLYNQHFSFFTKSTKDKAIEIFVKDNDPNNAMTFLDYDIPYSAYPKGIGY